MRGTAATRRPAREHARVQSAGYADVSDDHNDNRPDVYRGGWTLAAKTTNQRPHWVTAMSDWSSAPPDGSTVTLAAGDDAKSDVWSQVQATEFVLTDDQSTTNFIATNAGCIGGAAASDFFPAALATFPWSGAGPTSCGYNNATCATQYPETVFFWVK